MTTPDRHSPGANGVSEEDIMASAEYAIGRALREAMQAWQVHGPPTPEAYVKHVLYAFGTGYGYGYRRAHIDLTLED